MGRFCVGLEGFAEGSRLLRVGLGARSIAGGQGTGRPAHRPETVGEHLDEVGRE